ncbi:MAG: TlpA disulfide reductase family protein [Bacteroidota bacterium]
MNAIEKNLVTISGKINGDVSSVYAARLSYYQYGSSSDFSKRLYTTALVDSYGYFKFNLPTKKIGKIGQLVILYDSANKADHDILDNYVVEPGDSVTIMIEVKNHRISDVKAIGHSSEKYQCRSDIILKALLLKYERMNLADSLIEERKNSPGAVQSSLPEDVLFKEMDEDLSLVKVVTNILTSYKKKLRPLVYEIMKADLMGEFYWAPAKGKQAIYLFVLNGNDSVKKERVRSKLLHQYLPSETFSDKAIALSPVYVEYVYEKEVADLSLGKKRNWIDIVLSFEDLYNKIRNNYTGELRERLLTEMLVNPFQNSGLISMGRKRMVFVKDALSIIKTVEFKDKIRSATIFKVMEGEPAYIFNLPDTSGKMVRLSELRGNVILMDVWFTGCTGCVIFADKVSTQIKPEFKDNPVFKIVSINTDFKKEMWLKSLHSGKYSEVDNINLQARQPSENSKSFYQIPIIKYYGLIGLPFILLIDKNGNIVAQLTNDDSTEAILAKIKAAISMDN